MLQRKKSNTTFHIDKISKQGSHCICVSVILIDSIFKMGKNYYTQVFWEEYKYIFKNNWWLDIVPMT